MSAPKKEPLKLAFSIIAVALISLAALFFFWPHSVIKNPDDPRFDPKEFRFSNYSQKYEYLLFDKVMLKMFPPGTDKSYVQQILVRQGGADCSKQQMPPNSDPGEEYYNCHWPPRGIGGWVVVVVYNKEHKSMALVMNPKKPLYGIDPIYAYQRDVL